MAQYELNLRDYIRIFRKRRIIIIVIFILVTISSSFLSVSYVPSYEAVTTVKIEERKTIAGLLTEWIVYNPGDAMESQAKLIRSHSVMKKVASLMGIIDVNASVMEVNEAISNIESKLKTELLGRTNIIRIIAASEDPDQAIELANTVAEVFIEENLLDKTRQARNARQFIKEQLAALETRLKSKEQTLRDQREKFKNISLAQSYQDKLAELQFKLTELLQKYTAKHPNVVQIKEQITEIEKQNSSLSGQELEYAQLAREIEADKDLYSLLTERLEEARITEAQKVGDISIVNPAVAASKSIGPNRAMGFLVGGILGLVLGFAVALIVESLDTSIGTIEDVENLIKVPVLGVIPSVSLKGESKIRRKIFVGFRRRLLRRSSQTEADERYVRLISHYDPASPIAESYRNIHTNLKLGDSKKAILITSAGPREGKSSVLMNLGLVTAQAGAKTLVVSSDIRRPVIAKTLGVKREPGLTEVLLGVAKLDEVVKNITDFMLGDMNLEEVQRTPGLDNLWILTSGQLSFNPAKVLESKELVDLIRELKGKFDVIFFDSPPILPVTDASILAAKLDCVIMIYEIGRTSREALLRAKNQLDSVGAKTSGIILNQTRSETDAAIIYPYHYKYRYYGTETETSEEKESLVKT